MMRVPCGMTLVVGLGISGRAICRHLSRLGVPFMVADTRASPPGLEAFCKAYPGVRVHCGALTELDLTQAAEVVLSPGVAPWTPGLPALPETADAAPVDTPRVVGEIALFCRAVQGRVAAVTGSNAKSTVTTLLGEMAVASGVKVAVGGNLGMPALDLLADYPDAELYVLELSSFQLETTPSLKADCAAFLNLCEDHLDRHGDMRAYRAAKQRIFCGARQAVVNGDDPQTWPVDATALSLSRTLRFTTRVPADGDWGLARYRGETWLMQGTTPWLVAGELGIAGRHNQQNALAALAMGQALGLDDEPMRSVLRGFAGLPHRSETVARHNGIIWVNDSKGTNVGATLAAVNGLGSTLSGQLIVLAGGVGKGADFTPLVEPLAAYARCVMLFGADAECIARALDGQVSIKRFDDLAAATHAASAMAACGDGVLLSPACASLDQFVDYQARGEAFCALVNDIVQAGEATP